MIRYLENRILCPVSSTLSLAVLNEKAVFFLLDKNKENNAFFFFTLVYLSWSREKNVEK